MEQTKSSRQNRPVNYTINVKGRLMDMSRPCVMGILNVTPDSFFAESRMQTEDSIRNRANQIIDEGAEIIDVGACSTRPGGDVASEDEEMRRLEMALPIIRQAQPNAVISVDTFRASVARQTVEKFGADIINDVEEGADPDMFRTVADLGVPTFSCRKLPTCMTCSSDCQAKFSSCVPLGRKTSYSTLALASAKSPSPATSP